MYAVETLAQFFVRWGADWVLWLLLALLVGALAVTAERLLFFRTKGDDLRGMVGLLDAHLRTGRTDEALTALAPLRSVGAAVAAAGLRLSDRGPRAAEKAMESALAIERKTLENRLTYLGTLGNNAPFIGLFGTVIGVILAFEALGAPGTGPGQAASPEVMAAIAEALVATAVGIAVALPSVALYNYFQRRIAAILADADALTNLVVAYLVDETGGTAAKEDTRGTPSDAPGAASEHADHGNGATPASHADPGGA